MTLFSKIDYNNSLINFEREEKAGRRIRMGELETSIWLQNNRIQLEMIKEISSEMPDPRIVIIKEGEHMGFYIYSHKVKSCYRYSPQLVNVKLNPAT